MNSETQHKLAEIQNYATRYEIALRNESTGEAYLMRYASQHGKMQVLKDLQAWCWLGLVEFLRLEEKNGVTWNKKLRRWTIDGTSWIALSTGRTQRQCIIEGEFPFIREAMDICEREKIQCHN